MITISRIRLDKRNVRCLYCKNWAAYLYKSFLNGKLYRGSFVCGRHCRAIEKEMKKDHKENENEMD